MPRKIDYESKIAALDERIEKKKAELDKLLAQKDVLLAKYEKQKYGELLDYIKGNQLNPATILGEIKDLHPVEEQQPEENSEQS